MEQRARQLTHLAESPVDYTGVVLTDLLSMEDRSGTLDRLLVPRVN